jgi:Fic family protein
MDSSLVYRLDEASRAVATLGGVGETIQNPHLIIRPFIRREAVLSSRIEGTQASLSDLLLFEASGSRRPKGDVAEVANYVRAAERGIGLLDKLPISVRFVNELHSVLLRAVRGEDKRPGELRSGPVWIGPSGTPIEDARYVPPPADQVRDLLEDWEHFVNDDSGLPPLVQCALMHYQFEAIHPYMDGNGRIGRLLITLFLCAKRILTQPLLYLSAYFERDRQRYYDELFRLSATGDWSAWLGYFLDGVAEQANDALVRSRRLRDLQERYRTLLHELRESGNALLLLDELFANPYMTARLAAYLLEITPAGARRILERLVDAGIVDEFRDNWPRLYVARELLGILEASTATD